MSSRRKSKLPEANKMARSLRSGVTTGDLAVRYGINSHVIIQTLTAAGWDPVTGVSVRGEPPQPPAPLSARAGGPGKTCHHVGGGDNPNVVPTTPRPFKERVHPTGLAWPERPPVDPRILRAPRPEPRHRKPPREKKYDSSRGTPAAGLSAEQRATICERYRNLESSVELAREYGINDRTVRKLLRREGVQVRTRGEAMRLRQAKRRAETAAQLEVA